MNFREPEEQTPQERHTQHLIEAFLAKPRPAPHRYDAHTWSPLTQVCGRCGVSVLAFHDQPYGKGLPCANA